MFPSLAMQETTNFAAQKQNVETFLLPEHKFFQFNHHKNNVQ